MEGKGRWELEYKTATKTNLVKITIHRHTYIYIKKILKTHNVNQRRQEAGSKNNKNKGGVKHRQIHYYVGLNHYK